MKTISKVFALMLVLALAIVPVAAAACDSSDAAIQFDGNPKVTGGFSDMGDGRISISLYNTSTSEVKVTVKAVDYNNENRVYSTKEVTIPAKADDINGTVSFEMAWTIDSPGDKYIKIIASPSDDSGDVYQTLKVNVSHSIWKDPITYIVIVIVIIAIAIAVFLKIRANEKVKKVDPNAKTFTQMRDEKRAGSADAAEEPKKAVSAEKTTYEAKGNRKSKRKQ